MMAQKISMASRIPIKSHLEKYLGVPSIKDRKNMGLFQHLLNRIDNRLAGWKTKQFTLASRIVLANSTIMATPIYSMQSTLLPVALCNNIDKKVRSFIWDSDESISHLFLSPFSCIFESLRSYLMKNYGIFT